ncbi:alpha/beta hydrolase [Trinickia mobilis]|uniref:alpha/beta hydrolase n=1 Tax=Trinickia mobilis TaxID=2816356 RepID=UPI001F5CEEE1|nr:alpha/beta hydrolase [Trinickia mobilis]
MIERIESNDKHGACATMAMNVPVRTNEPLSKLTRPPFINTVGTSDGIDLVSYRWPAVGEPRATVALIHGLAEHAGRYQALAACLNAAGIEVVAVDLRGHGRSPGERAWVERFDRYLLDADALLELAAREHTPLFLMGHSMGGTIAALHALERPRPSGHALAGLILSSPALAPGRDVPRWMIAASRLISRVWPRFPAMKIDAVLLARDPAVVAANRADALVHHGPVPARTGAEILEAMARIENRRATLSLPVLVFHGTVDKLTEPEGSRDFAARAGSADRTLTLYEGSYHETMNDLDRERVIGALIEWIDAHV